MKNVKNQKGQGMTEYIILVALIAIVAIGAVRFFGEKTEEGFQQAGEALGKTNDKAAAGIKTFDN